MVVTMHETLKLSCGHTAEYDRSYSARGASAGDTYRCPVCEATAHVEFVRAESK